MKNSICLCGLSRGGPRPNCLAPRLTPQNADSAQLLRGQLLAQTSEKDPFLLPAGSAPVKVPLAAVAPSPPTPAGNSPTIAADKNADVTGGLLLVVTSADGQ